MCMVLEGKVQIVPGNLLLSIGTNMEASGKKEDQQDVDVPQDYVQAVNGEETVEYSLSTTHTRLNWANIYIVVVM